MTIQQNPETCKCAHASHPGDFCGDPDCQFWVVLLPSGETGDCLELCQYCQQFHLPREVNLTTIA